MRPRTFATLSKRALAAAAIATSTLAATALVPTTAHAQFSTVVENLTGYTKTKNPIVLVHGFLGFSNILGIEYFYGIPKALRDAGATVYVATVNPAQSAEYRGEQLLQQLKQWQAKDGVKKFNLIGHSHGGPTARYVAGVAPQLVASVSTVAATHYGSKTADGIGANTNDGSLFDEAATAGLALINLLSGGSNESVKATDLIASLQSLSTAGSIAFNAKFPDGEPTTECGQGPEKVNGIVYHSFSGVQVRTNAWDISDDILAYTATYFGSEPNDGLTGRCSSHWGKVIKDNYPWNHLDEMNQVLGAIGKDAPDPKAFYRQQANRLKSAGL